MARDGDTCVDDGIQMITGVRLARPLKRERDEEEDTHLHGVANSSLAFRAISFRQLLGFKLRSIRRVG